MNRLEFELGRIAGILADLDVSFAVVGGLAVSARAEPRFTRDIDLAVAVPGDREAEGLIKALVAQGFAVEAAVEQEANARLATVRLVPLGGHEDEIVVDLLFASSGIESEVVASAEEIELFPDLAVRVACVGHLIALKVLSRDDQRPQDGVDIAALLAVAGPDDLRVAERAVAQIEQRGYHRGRDLLSLLRRAAQTR